MDLAALELTARARLSRAAYDYVAGGADGERTLADNVAAWARHRLRPRVLREVSTVDASTTVLGAQVRAPVLVAPTAYQRLVHADGEREMARGAAAAGSVLIASTLATTALEEIAAAAPECLRWWQVYVQRDRAATARLVARAAAAGYRALVFTVDLPVLGRRRRDDRNGFALPPELTVPNLAYSGPGSGGGSSLADHVRVDLDPCLGVADIGWLRDCAGLPVLVKGVLRADDARACVDAGAAGIVVSNHGGRQLDGAIATADALGEVVAEVGAEVEVYVDGGVRTGTDVVTALALGARAVLIGRPPLWGLATGGAAGVRAVLDGLVGELEVAMALCGAARTGELTPDLIAPGPR